MSKSFNLPEEFRKELESQLKIYSTKNGENIQRIRQKVACDRFLARIASQVSPSFFLKGGYAMELRFNQARATKDIDLTCLKRLNDKSEEPHSTETFRKCLHRVFRARNTHELPKFLSNPPEFWKGRFEIMAKECGISEDLDQSFKIVSEYYSQLIACTTPLAKNSESR